MSHKQYHAILIHGKPTFVHCVIAEGTFPHRIFSQLTQLNMAFPWWPKRMGHE